MPNVIEQRGQFWWFGEEGQTSGRTSSLDDSVHGLLTVTREGQITLQLEGPLWLENPDVGWGWDDSRWLPPDKRIAGRLGEHGDAGYVLLHELVRTDSSLRGELARQSYEASFCFKCDFAFPPNFTFDSFHAFQIELEGLEEWFRLQSIYVGEEVRRGNEVEFTIKYKRIEISFETSQANVSIKNLVLGSSLFPSLYNPYNAPVSSANIRQINWLVYKPKKQLRLAQFQICFRRVEEVIALLVGQYCSLDWPKLVAKFGDSDDWFTLYWKRGPKHEDSPSFYFMMTTFPAVRENFGNMLDRWEKGAAKYGAGYDLYMASMQQPLPYPEHQFVNLVWAIESLHRSWQRDAAESPKVVGTKRKPTLKQRIIEAFQRLPFDLDPRRLTDFASRCAARRNDISHEGGQRLGEDAESFRADLQQLGAALRYLFHALLLNEIGLSRDLLLKALTRGAVGSMIIVPALRAVSIELPAAPEDI